MLNKPKGRLQIFILQPPLLMMGKKDVADDWVRFLKSQISHGNTYSKQGETPSQKNDKDIFEVSAIVNPFFIGIKDSGDWSSGRR